jgi:hypothetical protein
LKERRANSLGILACPISRRNLPTERIEDLKCRREKQKCMGFAQNTKGRYGETFSFTISRKLSTVSLPKRSKVKTKMALATLADHQPVVVSSARILIIE